MRNKRNTEVNKDKTEKLVNVFSELPKQTRIEAVIVDGQYYTIDKWAKVALVKEQDILDFIQENPTELKQLKDSYRVSCDYILKWYQQKNIPLNEPIVPNNFTPKVWYNKTEAEWFELCPKKPVSTVTLNLMTTNLTEDEISQLIKVALTFGKVVETDSKKLQLYTMNADYACELLDNFIVKKFNKKEQLRTREGFYWRELATLPREFVESLITFYEPFAIGLLKPHQKTLDLFLPERSMQRAQVLSWILVAVQKYDETSGVPFSGYLASVLQRWPYDLPLFELGAKLSKYQRDRIKAEQEILQEVDDFEYKPTDEEIYQKLANEYTLEEYTELESEHHAWLNSRNVLSLTYENDGREKERYTYVPPKRTEFNPVKNYKLSLKLIDSAIKSNDYHSLAILIDNFGDFELTQEMLSQISEQFKDELYKQLLGV